jgi:class 3 adenylate cyclase
MRRKGNRLGALGTTDPHDGVSDTTIATACAVQVLDGALAMAQALDELNRALVQDLRDPLRIGIGIHVGQAIVGEMGYGRTRALTAIGDAVNTASRLESSSKDFKAQLTVSEDVAIHAGVNLANAGPSRRIYAKIRSPLRDTSDARFVCGRRLSLLKRATP